MTDDSMLSIQVDQIADVAYVRFSNDQVRSTIAHDDSINIDLNEYRMVVGIEVLTLDAPLPFGDLVSRYHVDSSLVERLRAVQPSISGYVSQLGQGRAEVRQQSAAALVC